MTMTNEEICRDYRAAKAPTKQIQILAELNQCGKDKIKQILIEGGEKLPGNMMPKPKAMTKPVTELTPKQAPVAAKADIGTAAMEAIRARIIKSNLSDEDMIAFAEYCRGVVAMWEALI